MNNRTDIIKQIQRDSIEKSIYSYGTYAIFEKRAIKFKRRIRFVALLGVLVPLIAGGVVSSFGVAKLTPGFLGFLGAIGLGQVIASGFSLIYRWEEAYSYSIESMNSNYQQYEDFKRLAENPPSELLEAQIEFKLLEKENSFRTTEDNKQEISDWEKRMGMRAALRQFKRECYTCQQTPHSMKPTDCPTCGEFPAHRFSNL